MSSADEEAGAALRPAATSSTAEPREDAVAAAQPADVAHDGGLPPTRTVSPTVGTGRHDGHGDAEAVAGDVKDRGREAAADDDCDVTASVR